MAHYRCLLLLKHKEEKKHKKKTTKKTKKKNQEKGGNLPSSSCSTFSLLAPASGLLFLHFHFKCFILASSSSQTKEKKTHIEKKNA